MNEWFGQYLLALVELSGRHFNDVRGFDLVSRGGDRGGHDLFHFVFPAVGNFFDSGLDGRSGSGNNDRVQIQQQTLFGQRFCGQWSQ